MIKLKELREIVESELGKTNYNGRVNIEAGIEPYSAQVSLDTREMNFGFNLSHPELPYMRRIVTRDLPHHEFGHLGGRVNVGRSYLATSISEDLAIRKTAKPTPTTLNVLGIPGSVEISETHFFNPIYEVLLKHRYSLEDAHYLENTLEDSLLHLEGSNRRKWHGIVRFFSLQDFSEFYEAHVKLNMILWGDKKQNDRIKGKYKHSQKALRAVGNFLKRTEAIEKIGTEELRDYFLDTNNWKEISKIYAEEFMPLMTPNYARPTINHNGAGTKGREKEDSSKQGNIFQRQRKTDTYKKGRARQSYNNRTDFPSWMTKTPEDKIQALRLLYEEFVGDLEIRAETETTQDSLPISTLVSKEFDPLTDSETDSFVGINDEGAPSLYIPKKRLELPYQIKISSKGFPKIKYLELDSSGSMRKGIDSRGIGNTIPIPWGDNSKYHFSLIALESYIKFLIQKGLLTDSESFQLDNFSTETITARGLEEVRRVSFMPQWQDTYLDEERVREIFTGSENLITSISDGEIVNWSDVRDVFFEGAKRNYYFHFQIGKHSEASKDMKKNGLHVEKCKGHEDLRHKLIDLTRKIKCQT